MHASTPEGRRCSEQVAAPCAIPTAGLGILEWGQGAARSLHG